jgi:hypothetical protein
MYSDKEEIYWKLFALKEAAYVLMKEFNDEGGWDESIASSCQYGFKLLFEGTLTELVQAFYEGSMETWREKIKANKEETGEEASDN